VAVVRLWWLLPLSGALGRLLPKHILALTVTVFPGEFGIVLIQFILTVLQLVVYVHSDGLLPGPNQCPDWDRTSRCVPAEHSYCRVIIIAVDSVRKEVSVGSKRFGRVHSKVTNSLVYTEVNGQCGWHIPLQPGKLGIWAHSHCLSGMSMLQRL